MYELNDMEQWNQVKIILFTKRFYTAATINKTNERGRNGNDSREAKKKRVSLSVI